MSAEILIEMKRNFAVRPRPKPVSSLFEFFLDRLVTVEFTIHDDPKRFVFVGDWLISSRQVDNAQPCVSQTDSTVGCDPVALSVRTAMMETPCRCLQRLSNNRAMLRKHGNNSTHLSVPSPRIQSCSQPVTVYASYAFQVASLHPIPQTSKAKSPPN